MKKYKLLKELPWLEVWTIFEYNNEYLRVGWTYDITKEAIHSSEALQELIKYWQYKNWLEEIKEPKSIYELQYWDKYYYITDWFNVNKDILLDELAKKWDYKERLSVWNVFLTEQEAEKELNKRKALAYIKKWIWENEIKLKENIWYVIKRSNCRLTYSSYIIERTNNFNKLNVIISDKIWILELIFAKWEDAEKCLEECKNEWNILFNLKD